MNDCVKQVYQSLPNPAEELMPGVKWGNCDEFFTPAYWKMQYHLNEEAFSLEFYRISQNFLEEVCACILGGYGMRSETGVLAFERLKKRKLLKPGSSKAAIEKALAEPFRIFDRQVRYRFPRQKAIYLASLLNRKDLKKIPMQNDLLLREWLLSVKGIGMKTASWVTRNWLGSTNVAILDVHIYRAGLIAGFFQPGMTIERDYMNLEHRYLTFSAALGVNSASLDSLMWLQLKELNDIAIDTLQSKMNCVCQATTIVVGHYHENRKAVKREAMIA